MRTEAPPRPPEESPIGHGPGLRSVSVDVIVRSGLGIVAAGLLVYALTGAGAIPYIPAAILAFVGACYLAVFTSPSWMISLGLALSVFSGNSDALGLPIGPDRVLIAAGLTALALGLPGVDRDRAIIWRPLHAVLASAAAIGIVSAIAVGTFTDQEGLFALLDRLGLIPFLMFTLAPLIYGKARDRNALLVVLVGTGADLGLTALLEGTHHGALTWPSYINDPSYGTHFGRARGPFAEPVGYGMALYGCAVAAGVAAFTWETRRSRRVAGAVVVLCLIGTIFTLTRSIWLATVVATMVTLMANARTRRVLLPIGLAGTVLLVAALTFVPGFADQASERQNATKPLWDRYNTNRAALAMVQERPLTGVGWQKFVDMAPEYMHVAGTYPLSGVGIPVHNVPLSHAAELGVLGMGVWLCALALAMSAAIIRPGPEHLDPWRLGAVAIFVHWAIVASFVPLGYAFPNLLLWLWAGVAAIGHTSRPLAADEPRR